MSPETARLLSSALGLAYLEIVRPPADLVRERLAASGLAPLPFQGQWLPIGGPEGVLADAIAAVEEGSGVVVVEGPDGIGKSSLVRHVLEQADPSNRPWETRFPDGVAWLAADRSEDPEVDVAMRLELAGALGFSDRLPNRRLVPALAWDGAFQSQLWRGSRLLVLDDVPDVAIVERFTRGTDPAGNIACVVTTGRQWVAEALADEGAVRVRLEAWPAERIRSLLEATLGAERLADDPEGTRSLIELVGGLPLYARLAATGLQRARHRTLGDWVDGVRRTMERVHTNRSIRGPASRDPMVRGLLEGVGSTLSDDALQAVRDLAISRSHHFGQPFALAMVGGEASHARALLDELADAYLLRVVPDSGLEETRLKLSEWAVGAWGAPSDAAYTRLMRAGPELVKRLVEMSADPRRLDGLLAVLPGITTVLDQILTRVGAETVARSPDALAPLSTPHLAGVDQLPTVFERMAPVLRYTPPEDAGRWLSAGLSVLAASGPTFQTPVLAWWLGWWWWTVGEDPDCARQWVREAVAHADQLEPDAAASLVVHAMVLEWSSGTHAGRRAMVEQALERAEQKGVSPGVSVSALLHASACALLVDGDRKRSGSLLERALATTGDDPRLPVLHAATRLAGSVVELSASPVGEPVYTGAIVAEDAARVLSQLTLEPLVRAAVAHHVRLAGGEPAFEVPEPREAWLSIEGPAVASMLKQLSDVLVAIGAMPGAEPGAFDTDSRLGRVMPTVVSGSPFGSRPGASFILLLPLEPMRAILMGPARTAAMRFVAAARSEDHPVWRALSELG